MSNSSRGIGYTPETAEPLGVSPPEAVDLFLIKTKTKIAVYEQVFKADQ